MLTLPLPILTQPPAINNIAIKNELVTGITSQKT